MSASDDKLPGGLKALLAEPKGKLEYRDSEACLLHVFWTATDESAAEKLLGGLRACAAATHRDTPCTPIYFFRRAVVDDDNCPAPAATIADHPDIAAAKRKLKVGTPAPAVHAGLRKLGIDPALLDQPDDAPLPPALQSRPVAVEFTEVYLDERAFMEHAGSKDYLDGYGVVMTPGLAHMGRPPITLRLGTPNDSMVDKILEPVLKEQVQPGLEGAAVWRQPQAEAEAGAGEGTGMGWPGACLLSVDVAGVGSEAGQALSPAAAVPAALRARATTCVSFLHPFRPGTTRLMLVFPSLPPVEELAALAKGVTVVRGQLHMPSLAPATPEPGSILIAAGLGMVRVNPAQAEGYVLHGKAGSIRPKA